MEAEVPNNESTEENPSAVTGWKKRLMQTRTRLQTFTRSAKSNVLKASQIGADVASREANLVHARTRRLALGRARTQDCAVLGQEVASHRDLLEGGLSALFGQSTAASEALARIDATDAEIMELDKQIEAGRQRPADDHSGASL